MRNKSDCKNPWLCTALGFFLPLLGLIIGAIIGKGDGVKHALGGVALRYVLAIGGCLFLFSRDVSPAPSRPSQERRRSEHGKRKTWALEKSKSPIDDTTTYTITRAAKSPVSCGFSRSPAVLVIRQKEGTSEAYISWPMYLGSSKMPVTVRFDDDDAITQDWNTSTDGKAVFSPFPFEDFFGCVLLGRRLVVRLTPFGESPETAIFDISGLAGILDAETKTAFNVGSE